jgi:hypothetical protein
MGSQRVIEAKRRYNKQQQADNISSHVEQETWSARKNGGWVVGTVGATATNMIGEYVKQPLLAG